MVKRYKGGLISATEATTGTTIASGMWSTTTAVQARKAGAWPSLLPSEPPASTGGGTGPTISNVSVTNSSYTVLDDTPYIGTSGGYIKITGTGFASGCTVYVGGSAATSTTFVSATEVRAQIGAASSNTYMVYVVNPDSSTGILLNAITFSGTPTWVTGATLSDQLTDTEFSIALSATSDSSITYTLTAGSSTPSGTTLYSNGVFSGTVTGLSIDTNYSFSVDAIDAENQDTARTFTVNFVVGDTYFNVSPLLLNGESNVWIRDSSVNSFLPTINGDTRPTAFSPYNTNWSAFFDGTGDYITIGNTSMLSFGTGAYTIEFWYYGDPSIADYKGILYNGTFAMYFNTSNIQIWNGASPVSQPSLNPSVSKYKWVFIQVIRESTASSGLKYYIDGTLAATSTDATNWTATGTTYFFNDTNSRFPNGFVSDLRISSTARTAGVPTSRLESDANTKVLTLQNNRFKDNSANAYTITKFGDAAIKSFGSYTETDVITGSAYFDGTGDYLDYTGSANLAFGTSDWTIELWVYFTSVSGDIIIYDSRPTGTNGVYPTIYKHTDNSFRYYSSTTERIASTTTVVAGAWFHVAVARVSGTTRMFVNGTVQTTTYSDSETYLNGASRPRIGASGVNAAAGVTGYISDVRVLKGTGQYTANFTPATSSLSSVADTQLLTLQYRTGDNNHRFVEEGGNKYLLTRGGQVSQGSFSPHSPAGWSAYFDGTGDYLTVPASSDFNFGTDDYTVEGWIYSSSLTWTLYATGGGGSSDQFSCDAGTLYWNYGTFAGIASFFVNSDLNTWTHVAASRTSGNTRIFKNGGLKASTSTVASIGSSVNTLQIGRRSDGFYLTTGYMSNIRVVKGTSQYTANFTPATTALTAVTNTKLLILQNNRFIDANTTPKTITVSGDTKIQAFSPFRSSAVYSPAAHGGSAYFDGSGDYLKAAATSLTLLPANNTNTFTVDGWIYPTTTGTRYWIVGDLDPTGAANNVSVDVSSTNKVELYWYTGSAQRATSSDSVVPNQWNYFAIVVNNNAITIYVNSTTAGQTGTTTLTTRSLGTTGWGMGSSSSGEHFTGYMSGIRWSTGIARTISAIPTAPTAADNHAKLLFNFTNAGIYDATGRHNLETLGDAKVSNVASKFGSGSLYFDGTGDGLYEPYNPIYSFGTGDFTIEFWINQTVKTGYQTLLSFGYANGQVTGGWLVQTGNGDGNIIFYYENAVPTAIAVATESGSTVNTGTWYHIMIVKTGGNTKIYRNGTQVATGADTVNYSPASTTKFYIGGGSTAGFDNYYLNGYLDDLRITRYARTVAVPTSAHLLK